MDNKTNMGGLGYVMSANCENKEAAWELMKYITGEEAMSHEAEEGIDIPAYLSAQEGYVANFKNINAQVFMDASANGFAYPSNGNFDWTNGNFPEFTEPDQSYHGVVYTRDFGRAAYITKARVQLMRDLGCYPSAQAAFLLNHGLETLHLRMERHCQNADQVARFLQQHSKVESVNYPTLAENPYHQLAQKYLPNLSLIHI